MYPLTLNKSERLEGLWHEKDRPSTSTSSSSVFGQPSSSHHIDDGYDGTLTKGGVKVNRKRHQELIEWKEESDVFSPTIYLILRMLLLQLSGLSQLSLTMSQLTGKNYILVFKYSFGVVPIGFTTLSLFHDDPYMKVMHAYYAKESPTPPPTIVPPSTMFNPQKFFLLEGLLSPKKQGHNQSFSSTSALPQEFEMGESSGKTSLKRHEEQIEKILNHLDKISLDRIEHIEDKIEGLKGSVGGTVRDYKVKFATGTLTEEALSWWNSFAQPIGIEEAYKITWVEFKKLLIKKYCP
ncbi:hypothetical protein Tco_0337742 [Tanacetum coccineum]